jgi:PKD repeat protein
MAANEFKYDAVTRPGCITVLGPVTASFAANPTAGPVPLAVGFTDTSTGVPGSWFWDFGDGATSTERDPGHTYAAAGTYTVRLEVANAISSDSETRTGIIAATVPPPAVLPLPGCPAPPGDTDGDGVFDDVNGNGRADFADVTLLFAQMGWIAANEPVACFDCNDNGRIDFADVVWLFNRL